ncbi:hypothetical protein ATN91_07310 [Companilactobacillus kimchii]|nr:hypothetical protein ATN91_07310 [Companilactobacillus kimchii]
MRALFFYRLLVAKPLRVYYGDVERRPYRDFCLNTDNLIAQSSIYGKTKIFVNELKKEDPFSFVAEDGHP